MYLFLEAGIAAAILLLPFTLLRFCLFRSWKRTFLCFLFAAYLAAVWCAVGLPNVTYIRMEPSVNLIPFRDMLAGLVATVLNVVLFVPLGFFLTILWKPFRAWKPTLLFGFLMSLSIELLQIFTFRATDVNDLITNTLGTVLGWCLGRLALRYGYALPGSKAPKELAAIFGCTIFTMFLIHPYLMNLFWML